MKTQLSTTTACVKCTSREWALTKRRFRRRQMRQRASQWPTSLSKVSLRTVSGGRHEPEMGPQQRAEARSIPELFSEKGWETGKTRLNNGKKIILVNRTWQLSVERPLLALSTAIAILAISTVAALVAVMTQLGLLATIIALVTVLAVLVLLALVTVLVVLELLVLVYGVCEGNVGKGYVYWWCLWRSWYRFGQCWCCWKCWHCCWSRRQWWWWWLHWLPLRILVVKVFSAVKNSLKLCYLTRST